MAKGTNKNVRKATLGVYFVLFLIAVTTIPAVVGLAIVGLAPAIVAALVDQHTHRFQHVFTIFAFNLVGLFSYLSDILARPRNFGPVIDILTDVYAYLVMWGAAACGVALLVFAPQVAAMGLQITSVERLRRVKAAQDALITEWGKEVSGNAVKEPEDPKWAADNDK